MENILDQAEVVDILDTNIDMRDPDFYASLDFGTPEDISFMMEYLGIPDNAVLNTDNMEIMKTIHIAAKESGSPLYIYLMDVGSKIGGKFTNRYPEKIFLYIKLQQYESRVEDQLKAIKAEKKQYTP